MAMRRWAVSVVLLVTLAPVGCNKIGDTVARKVDERIIESQSGGSVKVDLSARGAAVRTKDGKQQAAWGEAVKLPEDFPKQIPIYPGSNVRAASADHSSKRASYTAMFDTTDAPDKVLDYYKDQLKAFKLAQDVNMGGYHVVRFDGNHDNPLNLALTFIARQPSEGGATVMVQAQAL